MALTEWLYYIGLEFLAFVVVDVVVKSLLRDAGNEEEKKTIWLYESAGLGLLCFVLYTLHHMPYVLITMTLITLTYTQFLGQTNLGHLITSLRAHWENHLQHEENMKQIERQKQQQQQLQQQALGMAGLNSASAAELNTSMNQAQQMNYGFPYFGKQQQGQFYYPPNATVVPGQDRPTYSVSPTSATYQDAVKQGKMTPVVGQNWNNAIDMRTSNFHHRMNPSVVSSSGGSGSTRTNGGSIGGVVSQQPSFESVNQRPSLSFNNNLQRRPLRSDSSHKLFPKSSFSQSSTSSIKSKFMNVIGFGPTISKPVGLANNGQNMCFINATIQCLSRGPFLVECLTADSAKELECSVAESELLSSLAELLDMVTVDPANSDYKVFNASRFRKAASVLNPDLVTPPNSPMRQQDAAEFLMWLLETVHNILNKNSQALQCDSANLGNDDRFSSPRLANLRLIYGDLNVNRIRDLKDQCRREIAVANGLENESYAEAIQRLSDLEWLTHKQMNDTVVDGLFTGQLVEAYHSLEHGHISVNLQSFNILPVPIASPRFSTGLVMLEDCFTSFCNIENLSEMPQQSAGLGESSSLPKPQPLVNISDGHNRKNSNTRGDFNATPVTRKSPRFAAHDSAAPFGVSPIHQSVIPSPILSTNPSASSSAYSCKVASSPGLPSALKHKDYLINDSGFHDNAFKTSTPVLSSSSSLPSDIANTGTNRAQPKLQRRCLLRQLPECLIIQLMRFRYDQSVKLPTKISTSVSVRLRNFNLRDVIYDTVTQRSDLTAQNRGFVYELYGICLHLGANSTSHGHYVSYCLDGDKWYRMDDENVEEVNMEYHLSTEEIRQNAYMLFYRKMGSDSV